MKATDWEFKNRAWLFGMVFAVSFPLYAIDQQNVAAALANWLAPRLHANADATARLIFMVATLVLVCAALIRTWGSSYLQAEIVYASKVKTESLVADGPYRFVRNPLYFANVLMAVGLGAMMSRLGLLVAIVLMVVFCYRLILREEADLAAAQGEDYARYRKAVPRLFPSPWPRIPSAQHRARWGAGLRAELWYWGFPASVAAFAGTLELKYFFIIFAAAIASHWLLPRLMQSRTVQEGPNP